jgi:hypothetical protein
MDAMNLLHAGGRRLTTSHARWTLRVEVEALRRKGLAYSARWNASLLDSYVKDRLARRTYRVLSEDALRASRRSSTVFIFGSGYSLNDIHDEGWAAIAEHDTFGFNHFWRQSWVRVDYHLIRGGMYGEIDVRPQAVKVTDGIRANPLYANTVFLMQDDFLGAFANYIVGRRLLPAGARIFRYRTKGGPGLPTASFADGVRHAPGTLSDAVNAAYLMGWKNIVLAGVDLYDSRYFFLDQDQTLTQDSATGTIVAGETNAFRGQRFDEPHNTLRGGVVDQMEAWATALAEDGVRLSVLNPRSLLSPVLPTYELPRRHAAVPGS